MKQTVEEAAVDFADYELKNLDNLSFVVSAKADYDNGLTKGFKSGAEWQSKQSPWISVKERLPEENKEYLVVLDNRVIYVAQYNKNNKSWLIYGTGYTYNVVVAYMPIPSFDEILEANRDVLERIKQKGD
jgi:hypothetical protein